MAAVAELARISATYGPFDLADDPAYQRWRDGKLARYPRKLEDITIEIRDPERITPEERRAVVDCCDRANMALYAFRRAEENERCLRSSLLSFGATFGLRAIEDH